jgi:hypothetical protein
MRQNVWYSPTRGGIMSQRPDDHHQGQQPHVYHPAYYPPSGSSPGKRSHKRGAVAAIVVLIVALIITAAWIEGRSSPRGASAIPPVPENLQLSGLVNGRLTAATAGQGMTITSPGTPADATDCVVSKSDGWSKSYGWEVNLYGQVGAHEMSLSFEGDDTSSSNEADTYAGTHALDNRENSGGLVYFYWGSLDLHFPVPGSATLIVNSDGTSGTMDIQFASGPQGGTTVETIKGSWRCGY